MSTAEIAHTLPYGRGLRTPDSFLRWVAGGVIAEFDGLVGCDVSDLIQEGRIGIWRAERSWLRKGNQIGDRGYVTYMMVSAFRRMSTYLQAMVHQLRVPPGTPRPKRTTITGIDSDDGGMEAARQSIWVEEQLALVEAVVLDLWPEHGARDFAVFSAWVSPEYKSLADIAAACDWLGNERAAQAVLERVILALREYFDGDVTAPIVLGALGNRGGSRGTRKSREEICNYQAEYYRRNQERLQTRSRDRMRQTRAARTSNAATPEGDAGE